MTIIYATAAKTARMTASRDAVADGTLELLTSADVVLVALGLSASSGTVSSGVWTLTFDGPAFALASGTAAKARIKNSAGTVMISGLTVSNKAPGATGEIKLDNPALVSGQKVDIDTVTIGHAPDA